MSAIGRACQTVRACLMRAPTFRATEWPHRWAVAVAITGQIRRPHRPTSRGVGHIRGMLEAAVSAVTRDRSSQLSRGISRIIHQISTLSFSSVEFRIVRRLADLRFCTGLNPLGPL